MVGYEFSLSCTVADVGRGRDACRASNIRYNRFSTNSTIPAEVKVLRRTHTPSTFMKILRKWTHLNNLSFSQGFVSLYLSYSQKLTATSSPKKIQQKCESNHQTREIPAWMCLKKFESKKTSFQPSNQQWHLKEVLPIHRRWNPRPSRYRKVLYQGVVTLPPEIIEMIDFIFWWSKEPETYRAPLESWISGGSAVEGGSLSQYL